MSNYQQSIDSGLPIFSIQTNNTAQRANQS